MHTLWQDIRYGVRMLMKKPGFTAVAIITLALGIGANTAIFSVVNTVLLRPLPFENPEQLVMIWGNFLKSDLKRIWVSVPEYNDYREQAQVLEHIAAFSNANFNVTTGDEPEQIDGAVVTASLFPLLGVQPMIGRAILPGEDEAGRDGVVVISHGLWQRRFGADPNLTGKQLMLNNRSLSVVGVMPAEFQFPSSNTVRGDATLRAEVWTPLVFDPEEIDDRGSRSYHVIGRLKPGVAVGSAQAEMNVIARRLEQQYPGYYTENSGWDISIVPLHEQVTGSVRLALFILFGAVGLVLLIACANVANLLLARATARHKEVAIRTALGAGRLRIVRQFLTESLLLSLTGGALGLLLAFWGTDLLVALSPADTPRLREIGIDAAVLGWTLLMVVVTSVFFGLAPALQASKTDLNESLKEGAKGSTGGAGRQSVRGLLVVCEVALSLVLLIGAGLLVKSFLRLQEVNPGFNPKNVLTMRLSLPELKYSEEKQRAAFYRDVLDRAEALPGVVSVGAISHLPLSGANSDRSFFVEGQELQPHSTRPSAQMRRASPDYFKAMSIPLVQGRSFTERDTTEAPKVLIINQSLARRYWPGGDPLGKRIGWGSPVQWREIVGVVGDVLHFGLDTEAKPEMYEPYAQNPQPSMTLVARTTTDPTSMIAGMRSAVRATDKDQPTYNIETMEGVLSESTAQRRLSMLLLAIFAVIALTLASIGLYGVMSYAVAQRTHEIGIRMALGAQKGDVLLLVVKQGMMLALIGVAIGLIAAFALTRVMVSLLYGVSATDPATFVLIPLLLAAVALVANYIPARRATKVEPVVALRYE